MARVYKGGCLCGHIRFTAEGPPLKPHTCSCTMCQHHSGALTLHWVEFPAEKVQWSVRPSVWRSSDYSSRSFCPKCGSTLGAIDDKPVVALVLGSFDSANRKELSPEFHSYAGKRPKWMNASVRFPFVIMRGLDPRILFWSRTKDGRDTPGHDESGTRTP